MMKKTIILCLFLVAFIYLFSSIAKPSSPSIQTEGRLRETVLVPKKTPEMNFFQREIRIVAIGDSLTEGFGDRSGEGGYVGIMKKELSANRYVKNVEVSNLGIVGLQSAELLQKLSDDVFSQTISKADYVFITIGGNDLVQVVQQNFISLTLELFDSERRNFQEQLRRIINEVHMIKPGTTIYVIGLFNPFSESLRELGEINVVIKEWNESIRETTQNEGNAVYVPIDDIFTEKPDLLYTDQFHPNQKGYEEIGSRLYSYFSVNSLPHLQDQSVFNDQQGD